MRDLFVVATVAQLGVLHQEAWVTRTCGRMTVYVASMRSLSIAGMPSTLLPDGTKVTM